MTTDAYRRTRSGAAMIVGTSATIQLGAAIAHHLFSQLGPLGVSALRFALGAALLLPAVRPRVRGRDTATWLGIAAYGASLAALNLAFFAAIERVPMGIAVTFAFVAPLALALVRSRRRRDVVAALSREAVSPCSAASTVRRPRRASPEPGLRRRLVAVAYAGRHVGARTDRVDGLALALPVAALVTLPLGLPHVGALDAGRSRSGSSSPSSA